MASEILMAQPETKISAFEPTTKKGWIKSIRQSKGLYFIASTDGGSDFQITIVQEKCTIEGELKVGCYFEAQGKDSKTPKGLYEFLALSFKIIGKSDDSYPIQPKHHSDDYLRTIPDLRGRAKKFQAIWKIRHHLTQEIHKFFDKEEFYLYQTPIAIDSDCEGAGETFQIKSDWLDQVLTVSGQLHLECGMMSLGKVYTLSPCFRAERSATKKHLAEFHMLEIEYIVDKLDDLISLSEKFVKRVIAGVIIKCQYEFKQIGITDEHLKQIIQTNWKRISYDEICEIFGVKYGEDINSETEQKIVTHYGCPVFITHYPKQLKPFYMLKGLKSAYCFDLIFPIVGELIGGSLREHDYDKLKESMIAGGLDIDKMSWYLNTRKWGSAPHGGCGLGVERLLMFITQASKIHDVIPFPVSFNKKAVV
jgi:asparaginyl-tRNA synthetase